ncbi:hypothetical protein C8R46DRAFT_1341532 [Mycena filopes]|nr:hypothetical protein C8R46DRAFT_1341532 [Mycena filopes]
MKTTETVTTIVSLLGGPKLNAEDIDWALDDPAGRRLLEWLVSQVELAADDTNAGGDESDAVRAALAEIALEQDEVQMLRNATRKTPSIAEPTSETTAVPAGYIPPWRARAKEEYLVSEATRLETETEILKSRLHQTKIASQSLSHAIKFIASEIEKTDRDVSGAEERLSELSLHADAALLASAKSSLEVMNECALIDPARDESTVSALTSARSTAIDRFGSQIRAIDALAQRLPTPADIQAECGRLDAALRAQGLDVGAELEAAWARDQAALLDARRAVLDEAIVTFSDTLLPPLAALHDALTSTDAHRSEARALVSALHEELQDLIEDLHAAETPKDQTPEPEESTDAELQARLTSVLKQLKDLRPPDAPPLVLLSEDDVLNELRAVYARDALAHREEETWIANLLPSLRKLETAPAPLLSATYAHSPMNTSAPFASPPDVRSARIDARTKADALASAIGTMQEDVKTLSTDRAKRRLEHFVVKWAK